MLGDTTPTGAAFFLTGDWYRKKSNLSPALTGCCTVEGYTRRRVSLMLGNTTPTGTAFFLTGDWYRKKSNLSPALTGETDLLFTVFCGVVRMVVVVVTVLVVGVKKIRRQHHKRHEL